MQDQKRNLISFQIMYQLYQQYKENQAGLPIQKVYSLMLNILRIEQEQLDILVKSKKEPLWKNNIRQARRELVLNNLIYSPRNGYWMLTSKGIEKMEKIREHSR